MDFDKAVAAFQRKKKGQDMAAEKREAYRAVLKDYAALKYAPTVGGVRKEREITQELIEKKAEEKKSLEIDAIADSLIGFVDIEIGAITAGGDVDLGIGAPKKGTRK